MDLNENQEANSMTRRRKRFIIAFIVIAFLILVSQFPLPRNFSIPSANKAKVFIYNIGKVQSEFVPCEEALEGSQCRAVQDWITYNEHWHWWSISLTTFAPSLLISVDEWSLNCQQETVIINTKSGSQYVRRTTDIDKEFSRFMTTDPPKTTEDILEEE